MNDFQLTNPNPGPILDPEVMPKKKYPSSSFSVAQTARRLKKTTSTVYGMISRKEIPFFLDDKGKMRILRTELAKAPRRNRGNPGKPSNLYKGAIYAKMVDGGLAIHIVAEKMGVTKQAVSYEILRFRQAMIREAK